MFMRSISSASTITTAHASACFSMYGRRLLTFLLGELLAVVQLGTFKVGGRITAAQLTGPQRQPRPASSHPASIMPG